MLVSRGDVPIVMNRTLLDLLGYETIDAFHDDGGMLRLFRGTRHRCHSGRRRGPHRGPDRRATARSWPSTLACRRSSGTDLPATLMTFRRAVDAEFEPRLKTVEHDLRRRETEARELRAILDTATDGVIVLDDDGRILSINRSGEALFGYDQSEIAGETFISLFAPDSHATALDYLEGLKSQRRRQRSQRRPRGHRPRARRAASSRCS